MLFFFNDVLSWLAVWPWPDFGVAAGTEGELAAVGSRVLGRADPVRCACGGSIPGIPPPVVRQALRVPNTKPRTSRALAPSLSRRRAVDTLRRQEW